MSPEDPVDPKGSPIGLGLIGVPDGHDTPADERIATIHAALDAGVTLLDTGDFYDMGRDEILLRKALQGHNREEVRISVKFGVLRDPSGRSHGVDTRPVAVRNSLAYTLRRLGTDYIDIYRPAAFSPDVPIEDTVGAIADLVKAGYVRHIGLPEVDTVTLRRAVAVSPISDLRIEHSLIVRGADDGAQAGDWKSGIGMTAYGVLSHGLPVAPESSQARSDPRRPRPADATIGWKPVPVQVLRETAARVGATVAQVAIAWALSRGPHISALVSVSRRDSLAAALSARRLQMSKDDLARINAALPVALTKGVRSVPRPETGMPSRRRARSLLTGREAKVLELVAGGMTNRSIANSLGISERTAREHVARILWKLGVDSRVEAAVIATERRLSH